MIKNTLIILFFISISFATECISATFNQVLRDGVIGPLILSTLMITIIVIALLYMVGSATSNASLIVLSKDEIFHLFFSVLLISGIIGIMVLSCHTFTSFLDFALGSSGLNLIDAPSRCYTGTSTPQAIASCYLSRQKALASDLVRQTLRESIRNEMESASITSVYNPISGGVSVPHDAYKKTYAMQFEIIATSFIMPAFISLTIQKIFLDFSFNIIQFMLPLALLLRVIPPTRSMGNILIALTIAIYVIIPVFYALNGAMDESVSTNQCSFYQSFGYQSFGTEIRDGFIRDSVMGGCLELIESRVSTVPTTYNFWNIGRIIPQAFFLPNLTIAIVITFLSGINKALRVLT